MKTATNTLPNGVNLSSISSLTEAIVASPALALTNITSKACSQGHGGTLNVAGQLGQGSTFTLGLPGVVSARLPRSQVRGQQWSPPLSESQNMVVKQKPRFLHGKRGFIVVWSCWQR